MKKKIDKRRRGRPDAATAAGIEQSLLDAARDHFTCKGFLNTSLDDIACSLGSSKHTIYRRFADKESIFEAVLERDVRNFRDRMAEALGSAPTKESLRSCAETYFAFAKDGDYASLYLFMKAEAAFSESMRRKLERLQGVALDPMRTALARLESRGVFHFEQVSDPCGILTSLIDGAADYARSTDLANPKELDLLFSERWDVFVRLFAKTIRKRRSA